MFGPNRTIHFKTLRLLLLSLLIVGIANFVRGDDLTGLPQNDPKDLMPAAPASITTPVSETSFVQMPSWARNIIMPPLPYQLKPMGKKPPTAVATSTPPLAPPKDDASTSSQTESANNNSKPAPAAETPAMVAVSPFLQWIKANPQAAAAQARQQANTYNASSASAPNPGANAPTGPIGNGEDPYWLPPLIDSAGVGSIPVTGSAAIYSTPQR
jgi:hypothetical protein